MNNLFKRITWFLVLITFAFQFEANAQIHDIKKKSKSNKSSRSSSSSSSSSSSDSDSDIASECIGGCLTEIFGALLEGCISGLFSGGGDDDDDYTYEYNYSNDEPTDVVNSDNIIKTDSSTNIITPEIEVSETTKAREERNEVTYRPEQEYPIAPKDFSLELRLQFDVSFHKGIDRIYTHIDYLPGIRANLHVLLLDFRYNILTEYTDNMPNSLKSWELLFMLNLTANQNYKVILGSGLQREIWDDDPISFHEWYLGTKIPFANGKDYFDADTRFSVDYETEVMPFFEIGGRYNKQFMDLEHLSGHITLGVTYQNYYQSYDIWGFRGGVILKWH